MSWRKGLIGILSVALFIEVLWPILGFLMPGTLLTAFKIAPTPDVNFLVFVLAWCLLFIAVICGWALRLVLKNDAFGWTLSYILGLWWVGIGGSLFLLYDHLDNLFLDGLKGAIICVCAWQSRASIKSR